MIIFSFFDGLIDIILPTLFKYERIVVRQVIDDRQC